MKWLKKCFGYGEQPSPPHVRDDRTSPLCHPDVKGSYYDESNQSSDSVESDDDGNSLSPTKEIQGRATPPILIPRGSDSPYFFDRPQCEKRTSARSPLVPHNFILGNLIIKEGKLCFFKTSKHFDYFIIYMVDTNRSETFIKSVREKNYELKLTEDHVDCYFKLFFYDKKREYLGDISSETITYMSLMSEEKIASTPISLASDDNGGSAGNLGFFHLDGSDDRLPGRSVLRHDRVVGIFQSTQPSLPYHEDDRRPSIASGSSSPSGSYSLSNDDAADYGQFSSL